MPSRVESPAGFVPIAAAPSQILYPGNRFRVSAFNEDCAVPQVAARLPRGRLGAEPGRTERGGGREGGEKGQFFPVARSRRAEVGTWGSPPLTMGLYEECLLSFSSEKLGATGLWSPRQPPCSPGSAARERSAPPLPLRGPGNCTLLLSCGSAALPSLSQFLRGGGARPQKTC